MSASDVVKADLPMRDLKNVPPEHIRANEANPRLHFPETELEKLAESIERDGILVPVVVYQNDDQDYVLIDGERRWRCAKTLGLSNIPAIITDPNDSQENLLQMFNIHMVREQWDEMPTAWALGQLIEETGLTDAGELSEMTGLSRENIQRYRHALELPQDYQALIDRKEIPLNFFWELKRHFIEPLKKKRPTLAKELKEDNITSAFVGKWQDHITTNAVAPRQLSKIVAEAERESQSTSDENEVDETIRRLVNEPQMSIEEAIDESVGINIEASKLDQKLSNAVKTLERLLRRAESDEEVRAVRAIRDRYVEMLQDIKIPDRSNG